MICRSTWSCWWKARRKSAVRIWKVSSKNISRLECGCRGDLGHRNGGARDSDLYLWITGNFLHGNPVARSVRGSSFRDFWWIGGKSRHGIEPDRGETSDDPDASQFLGFTIVSFRWSSGSGIFGPNFLTPRKPGSRQPVRREFPAKRGTHFWSKFGPGRLQR